ncbi:uncharacterized protein IL334_003486 [Kwoniella shivajii]|uniref:SH3 domain-containing protein n=1 Tax=Kwoniella shivajii TaxID=564305 RepID=A0ABZ1CYV8_9TREE|nr:hypothetical protein IL334_003486 [Kwoniella shivajii]
MSSQQSAQAFASHLINQTISSIALLESLSIISSSDASVIRQRLPPPTGPFPSLTQNQAQNLSTTSPTTSFAGLNMNNSSPSSWTVRHARDDSIQSQPHHQQIQSQPQLQQPPAHTNQAPTLPPRGRPAEIRAKALWDFSGAEADDLQFRSGDTIIVDEEVNDQWYRGRVQPNGHSVPLPRSGLFPSNYIEKIPPIPYYSSPPPPPPQQQPQMMVPYQGSAQGYYDQKPSQGQMQIMSHQQQVQGGAMIQQPPHKDNKFGKIGGQLGTAFTTGIGFGAGSAIASEAVHAIF